MLDKNWGRGHPAILTTYDVRLTSRIQNSPFSTTDVFFSHLAVVDPLVLTFLSPVQTDLHTAPHSTASGEVKAAK